MADDTIKGPHPDDAEIPFVTVGQLVEALKQFHPEERIVFRDRETLACSALFTLCRGRYCCDVDEHVILDVQCEI